MDKTEHFGLNLPGGNDYAEVDKLNENARKVDKALWEQKQQGDNAGKALEEHKKDTASHLTDGAQTINGVKTFAESPVVPEPKKPGNPVRQEDLNTHKQDISHHLTDGAQTFTGIKTFQDLPMLLGVPIYKNNPVRSVDLSNHTNNKNNPHGVTPGQISAYTKREVDSMFGALGCSRISIDTYTGTGTYGENNPTRISFPHSVDLIIFCGYTGWRGRYYSRDFFNINMDDVSSSGEVFYYLCNGESCNVQVKKRSSRSIEIYDTKYADGQFNDDDSTYTWIGVQL